MATVIVHIGRNVDGEPMHIGDWLEFQSDVKSTLMRLGELQANINGTSYSYGWGKEAAVWFSAEVPITKGLRERLALLADRYGQEAIGLTVGNIEFVKPEK